MELCPGDGICCGRPEIYRSIGKMKEIIVGFCCEEGVHLLMMDLSFYRVSTSWHSQRRSWMDTKGRCRRDTCESTQNAFISRRRTGARGASGSVLLEETLRNHQTPGRGNMKLEFLVLLLWIFTIYCRKKTVSWNKIPDMMPENASIMWENLNSQQRLEWLFDGLKIFPFFFLGLWIKLPRYNNAKPRRAVLYKFNRQN